MAQQAALNYVVTNFRRINKRAELALVDVAMEVDGVSITICGVQVRLPAESPATIAMPTYRAMDRQPCAAIRLSDEVQAGLATAVLAYLRQHGFDCSI
jgi:hypothetical protein